MCVEIPELAHTLYPGLILILLKRERNKWNFKKESIPYQVLINLPQLPLEGNQDTSENPEPPKYGLQTWKISILRLCCYCDYQIYFV